MLSSNPVECSSPVKILTRASLPLRNHSLVEESVGRTISFVLLIPQYLTFCHVQFVLLSHIYIVALKGM